MADFIALFDIDGTLVEKIEGHARSFEIAFRDIYGVEASIIEIGFRGKTDEQIIFEVLCDKRQFSRTTVEAKLQECKEIMVSSYEKLVENEEIQPLPGVVKLLDSLQAKDVALGLVTGNLRGIADAKLKKAGLYRYFEGRGGFGSDKHHERTDLVPLAIKRVGEGVGRTFSRTQAVLFGDTPADMKAAKRADVLCIGINEEPEELLKAGAEYVAKNIEAELEEILGVVERIKGG